MSDRIRQLRKETQYESSWQPRLNSYGGRTKPIPPATSEMLAPGKKGGALRTMQARERQTDVSGRPKSTAKLKLKGDEVEVVNPQEQYDRRRNDT